MGKVGTGLIFVLPRNEKYFKCAEKPTQTLLHRLNRLVTLIPLTTTPYTVQGTDEIFQVFNHPGISNNIHMLSIGKRFDHHLLFLFTNKVVTSLQVANIDRPIAISKYSLRICIRKLICPIKKLIRDVYTSAIETVQGYIWGKRVSVTCSFDHRRGSLTVTTKPTDLFRNPEIFAWHQKS